MQFHRVSAGLALRLSLLIMAPLLSAGDWPMWRCTPGRTGCTQEALPRRMSLQWTLQLPVPESCWPSPQQHKLEFDLSYEPIAAGGLLFVPSMVRDCMTAYDAATGEQRWRFFTDGPVRFAPAFADGRLFLVSDDGYLYCLQAQSGRLLWRLRGGPSERKVLGNGRLISMWPARGAPVVYEDTVYFAAGIWPFMGIFIYAVSAESGKVMWQNSGSGSDFILQPHSSPAFAGVAPQGHLVVEGDLLVVPGGRSVPAVFDRKTGKLLYYNINDKNGGYAVAAGGGRFLVDNMMYDLATGARIAAVPTGILTDAAVIGMDRDGAIQTTALDVDWADYRDWNGAERRRPRLKEYRTEPAPAGADKLLLKCDGALVVGGAGMVATVARTDASATDALIPPGSTWTYLAGQHPRGPWNAAGFDTAGWKTGTAGFGYGDRDDATVLSDMHGSYTAVYVRQKFSLDTVDPSPQLELKINYDDAFIAYLNGKEVLRVGVGSGSGENARNIKGHEARGHERFRLSNVDELLQAGVNVLAIEGHNSSAGSSDFSLDPSLAVAAAAGGSTWQADIEGTPWTAIAADGKLFVVTREGCIYCFGQGDATRRVHAETDPVATPERDGWGARAKRLVETAGVSAGYCLVLGAGTGRLAEALVRQTELNVIVLDPDVDKVSALRRRWTGAGVYGRRLAVVRGDIVSARLPMYLASLVTSEDAAAGQLRAAEFLPRLFACLRPYGGTACFLTADAAPDGAAVSGAAAELLLERAESALGGECTAARVAGFVQIKRPGPLPGSASWTHQYGDVANSVCSKDTGPRPPLGLLWFGGPSHTDVLPRHGHGPSELITGGRLFIQGIGVLSARDVYTGRVLWRRESPELNTFDMYYNATHNPDPHDRSYNQLHSPGANAYGSNFVVTADRLYLAAGAVCLVLDPATGRTLERWRLPPLGEFPEPNWGYIGVYADLLIAGGAPYHIAASGEEAVVAANNRFAVGSRFIVVLNRHTGRELWRRAATRNFRHNAVVAGNDRVFCIDGLSSKRLDLLARRGIIPGTAAAILALDAHTGRELWRAEDNVSGTWLGYSAEFDVLLEASARAGDRARDESGKGLAAYRGATGKCLWRSDASYSGPCILYHDRIITQTGGSNVTATPAATLDLLTGEHSVYRHPLTGRSVPWNWVRFKGCNTAVASENLLTFRSASGCYIDLTQGMGTVSIGGFKSGCTSNMIVADGVLNVPDYTRTCTCSYQNQTSFALVHMPDDDPRNPVVEGWSFDHFPAPKYPTAAQRVGLNLAAPGNRRDANDTLWLEVPSVGGPSPDLPIAIAADNPKLLRCHASQLHRTPGAASAPAWVAASGVEGITSVSVHLVLQPADPDAGTAVSAFDNNAFRAELPEPQPVPPASLAEVRPFTVRLHFAELADARPGERVFDVLIQGKKVLSKFDIATAAGGPRKPVSAEFRQIEVRDTLRIDTMRSSPGRGRPPLLCGIEILAEQILLRDGFDDRVVFSAPDDVRRGQPYPLTQVRLRSGTAARGLCRYRHDGETEMTTLPLELAAAGSMNLTLPGTLTDKPFVYCLELEDADGHAVRAPAAPAYVRVVPDAAEPGPVSALTVTAVKSYRVDLAWQPASDDCRITRYMITRSSRADGQATLAGDVPGEEYRFTDRGVTPDQAVTYQVRAVDGTDRIGPERSVDVRLPPNTSPANELAVSAFGDIGGVTLRWQGDLEEDVADIEILRGESADGPFELINAITDRDTEVYTDSRTPGREWWYRIRLRDMGKLDSPPSASVSGVPLPLPSVFVSDLKHGKGSVGWGKVMRNRNSTRKECRLGGKTFRHALGVFAASVVTYELKPEYRRFVSLVGIDDALGRSGSIRAIIKIDGATVHESPVLRGGDTPWPVNVAIPPGSREIALVVDDGGDGTIRDMTNWASAGFVTD